MHVPDGIIPLWLQLLMLAVSATTMVIAYRKIRNQFDERLVPYMGVLAAVIFAAQLVNFPVPPFSSGHLVGSTLLAVMVNPWVAMLIMALVLFVQALYGDGGILTYGLNQFNMGIFSVLIGFGLALALFKILSRFTSKEKATLVSASTAAFIVTIASAFVLGLQLLSVAGFGFDALIAITGVHVIIGLGEAILTGVILLYFVKSNPSLVAFLRDDSIGDKESKEEIEGSTEKTNTRSIVRKAAPILITSIVLVTMLMLSGLASENPDGFEWALFEFAGVAEPEQGFEGIWNFLSQGQFTDVLTGMVGILAVLGIGLVAFRRATHRSHKHEHTDKFLLPFDEGKEALTVFSPTAMILSAIALAIVISLQSVLSVVLSIIVMTIIGGWFAGTGWRRVISLATKFEIIILFWIIFEPFLYGSTVILTIGTPWGPINAYLEGLYLGLLLGARMFAILLTFLATLSHMTLNDFIGALRSLRIPASILGSLLIMFRYVPLFMEERSRMQDAQMLRGFSRGQRLERIKSLGFLVGATINRSFDRSVTAYEAMSLRGFGNGTFVSGSGFKRSDAILPLLILFIIVSAPFIFPLILEVVTI
ncbi:MAG: energy-coupling factor ABC transporter permease [Candidatus Thorarchaeota archaeon]|jgi:cobalt/nickel transport system permease protein